MEAGKLAGAGAHSQRGRCDGRLGRAARFRTFSAACPGPMTRSTLASSAVALRPAGAARSRGRASPSLSTYA